MNHKAVRFLSSVLVGAAAALAGCDLLGIDRERFVIQVDSIDVQPAAESDAPLELLFYGPVGPDGCYSFKEFKVSRSATGTDVTVIGEHRIGDCTLLATTLDGELLVLDPPIGNPITIRVHQPDRTITTEVLTRIIR
jgi:hypothetical protein